MAIIPPFAPPPQHVEGSQEESAIARRHTSLLGNARALVGMCTCMSESRNKIIATCRSTAIITIPLERVPERGLSWCL